MQPKQAGRRRFLKNGAALAGLAMAPVAVEYGLDFVPLAQERFELVVPTPLLEDPRIARLAEAMNGAALRRELASLGGYDVSECGKALAS